MQEIRIRWDHFNDLPSFKPGYDIRDLPLDAFC